MRTKLPTRRLVGGVPSALLLVLLVFARLIAPALAMPGPDTALLAFDRMARDAICHAAPGAETGQQPSGEAPAGHGDCLLCPACHLVAAAALPAPAGPVLPRPTLLPIGRSAPLPPATGPPPREWAAIPPTGPPAAFA